ncbi:MAG: hypothetical protein WBO70_07065 [Erysipelotrichaceae bacterium]
MKKILILITILLLCGCTKVEKPNEEKPIEQKPIEIIKGLKPQSIWDISLSLPEDITKKSVEDDTIIYHNNDGIVKISKRMESGYTIDDISYNNIYAIIDKNNDQLKIEYLDKNRIISGKENVLAKVNNKDHTVYVVVLYMEINKINFYQTITIDFTNTKKTSYSVHIKEIIDSIMAENTSIK